MLNAITKVPSCSLKSFKLSYLSRWWLIDEWRLIVVFWLFYCSGKAWWPGVTACIDLATPQTRHIGVRWRDVRGPSTILITCIDTSVPSMAFLTLALLGWTRLITITLLIASLPNPSVTPVPAIITSHVLNKPNLVKCQVHLMKIRVCQSNKNQRMTELSWEQ